MPNLRTVKIVLDVDWDLVPPGSRAHYRSLGKPLVLVQVAGNRVRVVRRGQWSYKTFRNTAELAEAMEAAGWDAMDRAHFCQFRPNAYAYYLDVAAFWQAAAMATLEDDRIARMWIR